MNVNSETDIVLKYKRTKMCWICTSCETENDIVGKTCFMCGKPRTVDAAVENVWGSQPEVVSPRYAGGSGYSPSPIRYEDNKNNSGLAVLIWAIAIMAVVILLLAQM